MCKLIILDRDGVINDEDAHYIRSPDDWLAIPGSLEAIAELYQVVVATNQSGIGRGYYDVDRLKTIHQKMQTQLAQFEGKIDGIFFCPHHPHEGCNCRKPKTGLVDQIKQHFSVIPNETWFIGDSLRDLQAAQRSQCVPVLVKTGHGLDTLRSSILPNGTRVFETLSDAIKTLLRT